MELQGLDVAAAKAAVSALDDKTVPEVYAYLHGLVGEQAPVVPLMYGPSVTVLSRRVRAFEPHPLNIYPTFAELELED